MVRKPAKSQTNKEKLPGPLLPKLEHWKFEIDYEKIGWLTIDTPGSPVNALGTQTIEELEKLVARFDELGASGELVGIALLSGKASGFVAGADISEFDRLSDESVATAALERTHTLFNRIEKLSIPFVCGIHGFCLGGGLELALACHYRVAVNEESTSLGFPEVKLGLFPGFGGTGRSILRAGPVAAMQMMLTGRIVKGRAVRALNLVDKLVRHRDQLPWELRKAIAQKRRSRPAGWSKRLMAQGPLRGYVARKMRTETAKKANKSHYPAPFKLIDLFEQHGHEPAVMQAGEIARFVPLLGDKTAINLRRLFFLSEGLKKQGVRGKTKPKFLRVHVIGAGVMGGDIAAWCALRGMAVTVQDLDEQRVEKALERAGALFKKRLRTSQKVKAAQARLTADIAGNAISRADVIIEAVVEDLKIKQKIFADIEARARPEAILATNTSSIELEKIAVAMTNRSRLIGLHFFNPVAQLPLVEVIQSKHNDEAQVRMGCSFASAIGKQPVIVKSAPGFLVNRVLMPYLMGAIGRLEAGDSPELLDAAAVAFGMPMGPIELMDVVGLDIGQNVAVELGQKVEKDSRFARLIEQGNLGRKSGRGFYRWTKGRPVKNSQPMPANLVEIGRELMQPMVDACEEAVRDGIVASADLADIGVILGTGFAPFLGGPMNARAKGEV